MAGRAGRGHASMSSPWRRRAGYAGGRQASGGGGCLQARVPHPSGSASIPDARHSWAAEPHTALGANGKPSPRAELHLERHVTWGRRPPAKGFRGPTFVIVAGTPGVSRGATCQAGRTSVCVQSVGPAEGPRRPHMSRAGAEGAHGDGTHDGNLLPGCLWYLGGSVRSPFA